MEIWSFVACKAGGILPAAEFDWSCSGPQTLGPCTWIPLYLQASPRVISNYRGITWVSAVCTALWEIKGWIQWPWEVYPSMEVWSLPSTRISSNCRNNKTKCIKPLKVNVDNDVLYCLWWHFMEERSGVMKDTRLCSMVHIAILS